MSGRMRRTRVRKLKDKLKAMTVFEVMKETGKINFLESYRRWRPGKTEGMNRRGAALLKTEGVMDELERLLKVRDQDLLKKLKPEVIVQDLLDDLRVLSELVQDNKTNWEAVVKLLNAKAGKQKLIGMAIGIWKAEKPQEREKDADELFRELHKLGGRN